MSVSRQEKTGPWGVNSQEPLQVQTKPAEPPALGNQGRPRAAEGRPPFLLSASWAGAFLGLGHRCEAWEGHMDLDSPWPGTGRVGLAP